MLRIKYLLIPLCVFILAIPSYAKKQTFDELCQEILESFQEFYPVKATEMGIHAYDHRFTDYSSKSVKNMIKKLTDYEKKLYPYKSASLSTHNRINYHVIKSNVDIALLDLDRIEWHEKSPQLYVDDVVNGLYTLLLSNHAPLQERLYSILSRMKAVRGHFEQARKNLKNPPQIYIDLARESLETGIAFYKEVGGDLMNKFPERADEILKVSTGAREAMNDFLIYLLEIKPGKPGDFAIGKRNFDYKLSNEYFLDYDSDSLLKIGMSLYAQADSQYQAYKQYVEGHHQNGTDSVFVPSVFTKQDILDYYNWETEQVKIYLEQNDIVTVPENIAPVEVVETPPFLRSMVAGIAYHPAGPFDSVQQAYFYVRPIPDDLDRRQLEARCRYVHRRGFKGSVIHEAYPGHHLQMQLAGMNPDPVRKWQQNLMCIEGWALYCEEMMYSTGLFGEEDHTQWLAILGGIRFRAARIVADVKLHTGQFSYDECVNWMIDALEIETEAGKEYIRKQVRKYTLAPTMPMSYLSGKTEIMALRDAFKQKAGETFTMKQFHDALLSEGSIPPALLWDALELR